MERNGKDGTMHRRLMALAVMAVVGVWAVSAWAEAQTIGDFCWQLLPFQDYLKVEAVQRDPMTGDFALYGAWIGQIVPQPAAYVMQGGGSAVHSFDHSVLSVSIPVRNTTTFFQGQPIGRFTATMLISDLTGLWYADFVGGDTPFAVKGTLSPFSCSVLNPLGRANVQSTPFSTGRLAGE